ncbi:MAG: class I SAM-dependent methyltransferase [Chloroflexi bacterium]|nr:class I SAM-dependent methyltransferase [Chloroflexota bacterium]
METTFCSLCEADDAERLLTLRDYGFDGPGEFPLVRCRQCGLMYLNPRPGPAQMDHYYPADYLPYKSAIEDERWALMRWVRRYNIRQRRRAVERFSRHVPRRVLDVGCSTGIFLAEMRDAGWETYGVDISPIAIAYARERFGLDAFEGLLADADLPAGQFTAVTLWDVLEHTFDPLETLQTIHRLLKADGIVVIAVPHYESWDRQLFGRYWIGYDAPRHLHVFSRDILRDMLDRAGFDVVHAQCAFGGYYTFTASLRLWINQRVRHQTARKLWLCLLSIPGMRLPFMPITAIADRLGRGSKLTIVARKTDAR